LVEKTAQVYKTTFAGFATLVAGVAMNTLTVISIYIINI
jgi:hypothetical protein